MSSFPALPQIAPSDSDREQLAKRWLLRVIDETPLEEVGRLPVAWIVEQGPPLIATISAAVLAPAGDPGLRLEPHERDALAELTRARSGPDAAAQLARELSILQALLGDDLRQAIPGRREAELGLVFERLASAFGAIQGVVASSLVEEHARGARTDLLTGLPGPEEFEMRLEAALAEHRRYGHPFAIALIDLDGLGRINDAYGREAGDRMLAAVAAVVRRHVRGVDQAFRVGDDELCVLAPHQGGAGLRPAAERIAALIASAQAENGPRIGIAIGIGSCPDDGETAEAVREAAERAVYEAKASGRQVSVSPNGRAASLQDP